MGKLLSPALVRAALPPFSLPLAEVGGVDAVAATAAVGAAVPVGAAGAVSADFRQQPHGKECLQEGQRLWWASATTALVEWHRTRQLCIARFSRGGTHD